MAGRGPQPGNAWYGRYAFRNTLGSYKPHIWAGHRWDHMRDFVEPKLRDSLDRFSDALFWHRLEDTTGVSSDLPGPCTWEADLSDQPGKDAGVAEGHHILPAVSWSACTVWSSVTGEESVFQPCAIRLGS